jgi:hypothetical protein
MCVSVQIRVTLKQMLDVYILFHACAERGYKMAQFCLFKLLASHAFVPVAFAEHVRFTLSPPPHHHCTQYNPLIAKEFDELCAWDVRQANYSAAVTPSDSALIKMIQRCPVRARAKVGAHAHCCSKHMPN